MEEECGQPWVAMIGTACLIGGFLAGLALYIYTGSGNA